MSTPTPDFYNLNDLVYTGRWWRNRGIVALNGCISLAMLTAWVNGFDSSVLNGLQIVPEWQEYYKNPNGVALGLMNAAQNIGGLAALPFAPILSDGLGRRKTLFTGSCIMLGGVALQVTATGIVQFILSRVLIGFGLCFCTNAAPVLITELAYPTQRGPITALYNSSWYIGSIIAAWLTFGTYSGLSTSVWSWRIPSLLQALPSVIQAVLIWFIPESPRWLIAHGKHDDALAVLSTYHANGNPDHPLVHFTFTQIKEAIVVEREIAKNSSYLTLFATPGNRRRMRIIIAIALFSQWSGNGLGSYYLNDVLEAVGVMTASTKALVNGGLQIWNCILAISAALLVDRLGRRFLFLASNSGMVIAFAMWTLTTALFVTQGNAAAANGTIALIFIFFAFYDIAYTPLLVAYSVEILPFTIRAKGFAVMNLTVVAALAFNQFVNPVALEKIGWKYYLVYCGWLAFELVFVYTFIVETRGKTLEETAALFDGELHSKKLHDLGTEAAEQLALLREGSKNGIRMRHVQLRRASEDSDEAKRDMAASFTTSTTTSKGRIVSQV